MTHEDFIKLNFIPGDSLITLSELITMLGDSISNVSFTIALDDGGCATVALELSDACEADGTPDFEVTKISSEISSEV